MAAIAGSTTRGIWGHRNHPEEGAEAEVEVDMEVRRGDMVGKKGGGVVVATIDTEGKGEDKDREGDHTEGMTRNEGRGTIKTVIDTEVAKGGVKVGEETMDIIARGMEREGREAEIGMGGPDPENPKMVEVTTTTAEDTGAIDRGARTGGNRAVVGVTIAIHHASVKTTDCRR
jgi:hypothetical protein